MRDVPRVKWLSRFDLEPLLSHILRTGMFISVGLITAGFLINRIVKQTGIEYKVQAASIPRLIQADLRRSGSPDFWFHLLVDLGFVILLITPYVRLVVTWLYFVFVKHRWKYVVYASIVLSLLGVILFSDIVLTQVFRIR